MSNIDDMARELALFQLNQIKRNNEVNSRLDILDAHLAAASQAINDETIKDKTLASSLADLKKVVLDLKSTLNKLNQDIEQHLAEHDEQESKKFKLWPF